MKKFTHLILLLLASFAVSCSSDDGDSTQPPGSGTAGFTWRENDPNSTTIQSAFSPQFSTQYNTLIAKTQAGSTLFEVNLTGSTLGNYSLNTTGNAFTYTGVNPFFVAESGTVVITANANSKISGTIEAFRMGSSGITRIYATFTDVAVVP